MRSWPIGLVDGVQNFDDANDVALAIKRIAAGKDAAENDAAAIAKSGGRIFSVSRLRAIFERLNKSPIRERNLRENQETEKTEKITHEILHPTASWFFSVFSVEKTERPRDDKPRAYPNACSP